MLTDADFDKIINPIREDLYQYGMLVDEGIVQYAQRMDAQNATYRNALEQIGAGIAELTKDEIAEIVSMTLDVSIMDDDNTL